jgi:hypothetical protein
MIELILYEYLKEVLEEPVYMQRPEKAPTRYVLLEKTGSSEKNHIKSAVIAFQSYAETLYEAAALNERVKEAVKGSVELDEISGVQLNSDYNFTDVSGKQYRYQALFVFTHY